MAAVPSQQGPSNANIRALNAQGPLVVNGSNVPTPISIPNWQASVSEGAASEYHDAAVGSMDSSSHFSLVEGDFSRDQDFAGQMTPKDLRFEERIDPPMIVNGSTSRRNESTPTFASPSIPNGVSSHQFNIPNGLGPEHANGVPRLSPNMRNRLGRQAQNGGISPLDIGTGQSEILREDIPHLSPVYETQTPSPIANRRFEPSMDRDLNGITGDEKERKSETSTAGSKLGLANVSQIKQTAGEPRLNGHTRASKSEGSGSWHKISKSKKKGASAELKSSPNGRPHSEKQPSNDSERKGG